MKNEILKLWADALASGQWPQIHDCLHAQSGWDAFGVLCELYRQKFGGEWKEVPNRGYFQLILPGETHQATRMPPDTVLKWLEVKKFARKEGDPEPEAEFCQKIWRWNDIEKKSFAEIAAQVNSWVQAHV